MSENSILSLKSEPEIVISSVFLNRKVQVDIYYTASMPGVQPRICIVNDGQDLVSMDFKALLARHGLHKPCIFIALHCGTERVHEYGMSAATDYLKRGKYGKAYEQFIVEELIVWLKKNFPEADYHNLAIAGFSMGGLKALDLAWNHPEIFTLAGIFSGALWWRSVAAEDKGYNPNIHRMMHRQISLSDSRKNLKLFFQCGLLDESADRNKNGVIDSIDDTIDLMRILLKKGLKENHDFFYLQLADGKHDIETWSRAWPAFFNLL